MRRGKGKGRGLTGGRGGGGGRIGVAWSLGMEGVGFVGTTAAARFDC